MDRYTRMGPTGRIQKLIEFNKRLQTCQESAKTFSEWNMKLDDKLIEVEGRVLQSQNNYLGRPQRVRRKK